MDPSSYPRHVPIEESTSSQVLEKYEKERLSRNTTIIDLGSTPRRSAAELKIVLGSDYKPSDFGPALLSVTGLPSVTVQRTNCLDKGKFRTRVQLDIVLDCQTRVQGGYLQGHINVQAQRRAKKDPPIQISDGKIRVIGYERLSNKQDCNPFYHCSSHFSVAAPASRHLYESRGDVQGFSPVKEGDHSLPFSMYLPLDARYGVPKGALPSQSSPAIRYIAMVSVIHKSNQTQLVD